MKIIYLILNILIAFSCISGIYSGWKKGIFRMALELAVWLASFFIALKMCAPAALEFPFSRWLDTAPSMFEPSFLAQVVWFFIIYVIVQAVGGLIITFLAPYTKVKGVFSLANHLAGLVGGFVITCLNIMILVAILNCNFFGFGRPFLEHSWLKPASSWISAQMMEIEEKVEGYDL